MFADYAKLPIVSNKLLEPGTSGFQTIFLALGLYVQKVTLPYLFIVGVTIQLLCFYTWMILFLTASSEILKAQLIDLLKTKFAMTGLGQLSYFLGISVTHTPKSMFLCQQKYVGEIIHRAKMDNC